MIPLLTCRKEEDVLGTKHFPGTPDGRSAFCFLTTISPYARQKTPFPTRALEFLWTRLPDFWHTKTKFRSVSDRLLG